MIRSSSLPCVVVPLRFSARITSHPAARRRLPELRGLDRSC
jgi:hypothetical protein